MSAVDLRLAASTNCQSR